MANLPISALDVQTTLLDTDLLVVVDTTDHSMAVTGTDKQITAANVIAGVKAALVTVPNTLVPFGDASSDLTTDANFNYVTSTLTAPTVKGKSALQVEETGGGGDAISIVAPATIPAPYTITLPDQVGTNGQVFSTSGLGVVTYTSTASDPTASTIMTRDVNGNTRLNVLGRGVTTTATSGGTTTLNSSSTANQIFTGVTTQTVRLPDVTAANMAVGFQWIITNQSTGTVTVQTNSGAALSPPVALTTNQSAYCTVVSLSNNLATSWVLDFIGTTTGSGVTSLNTLSGALTMSQVVAVNDAGSAGGSNSIQIGTSSSASGADAICIGRSSTSSAADTVSIGRSTMVGGGSVSSIAIGTQALNALTSAGTNNFAAGLGAGKLITNGVQNVIIGANALDGSATASSNNVAIGYNAATAAVTTNADGLVAIGSGALSALTSGARNTAVGYNGGNTVATTTGSDNTFVGYGIISSATALSNTLIGSGASAGLSGSYNTASGASSTASGSFSTASGANSTASGSFSTASGANSTASGDNSVALGISTTATQSGAIAIGNSADSITGTNGIAIGTNAQSQIGNGIAIGNAATVTTTAGCIAIGPNSSATAASANPSISIGSGAKSAQSAAISIGVASMALSGGAAGSVAIGFQAFNALQSTGTGNVGVGTAVGINVTTGTNNTVLGENAFDGSAAGCSSNTAIGFQAATAAVTTAANGLVAVGDRALNALTSGAHNTHVGYNGGSTVATTTGDDCTFVGYGITSGATKSNNTIMGSVATAATFAGCSIFGKGATATADNQLVLRVGNSATTELVSDLVVTAGTPVAIGTEPYITVVIGGNSYKIALRS